jgi:hypothetical protein
MDGRMDGTWRPWHVAWCNLLGYETMMSDRGKCAAVRMGGAALGIASLLFALGCNPEIGPDGHYRSQAWRLPHPTTCKSDADCTLTDRIDGECCPTFCVSNPRNRHYVEVLGRMQHKLCGSFLGQAQEKACPIPVCRDRPAEEAVCVSRRCALRIGPPLGSSPEKPELPEEPDLPLLSAP